LSYVPESAALGRERDFALTRPSAPASASCSGTEFDYYVVLLPPSTFILYRSAVSVDPSPEQSAVKKLLLFGERERY